MSTHTGAAFGIDSNGTPAETVTIDVVVEQGRGPRRRIADLQIAATALANDLVLVTRNPADVGGLERLLQIVAI